MKYAYYFTANESYYITYEVNLMNHTFQQTKTIATFEMMMKECEVTDGIVNELRKETKQIQFEYPSSEKTPNVIFQRMRKNKDCLLRLVNVSDPEKTAIIGIDDIRYDKNPVLVRGFFEEESYTMKMTGEIIQQIPITNNMYRFDSTIVDANFSTVEWPTGFFSEDAIYDATKKFWLLNQANYSFSRSIPKTKAWTIQMKTAPILMPQASDALLFEINSDQLGRIVVRRNQMSFQSIKTNEEIQTKDFNTPIVLSDLYLSGLTQKSLLEIKYANQLVMITYNGISLQFPYAFGENDQAMNQLDIKAGPSIPKVYFDDFKIVYHV